MASYFEEHDCTPLSDGESIGISEITRFILKLSIKLII